MQHPIRSSILPSLPLLKHMVSQLSPRKKALKRVAFNLALPLTLGWLAACHYVIRGDKWNFPSLRPDWSVNAVPMRILSSPLWSGLAPTMRTVAFLITHGREEEDGKGHIKRTPSFRAKQGFTLAQLKGSHRFGEICSCSCSTFLPDFASSIHATWGPPFSRAVYFHA